MLPAFGAERAMHALLSALEGGFLLARVTRSTELLLGVGHAVSAYVAGMPATARAWRPARAEGL